MYFYIIVRNYSERHLNVTGEVIDLLICIQRLMNIENGTILFNKHVNNFVVRIGAYVGGERIIVGRVLTGKIVDLQFKSMKNEELIIGSMGYNEDL